MMGNPEQEYINKSFSLKQAFQQNMLEMMGENMQLRFVQVQRVQKLNS